MTSITTKLPQNNNKNITNSRRTQSFSSTCSSFSSNSSSSLSSSLEEDQFSLPDSPSTSSGGIPFSWESFPGIPKNQLLKKIDSLKESNGNYLPLPAPPVSTSKKHSYVTSRDPFYVALVQCSKDSDVDDDNKDLFNGSSSSFSKRLSTRFGNVNASCKNASNVVESLVFLPRGHRRRVSYDVLKKRVE